MIFCECGSTAMPAVQHLASLLVELVGFLCGCKATWDWSWYHAPDLLCMSAFRPHSLARSGSCSRSRSRSLSLSLSLSLSPCPLSLSIPPRLSFFISAFVFFFDSFFRRFVLASVRSFFMFSCLLPFSCSLLSFSLSLPLSLSLSLSFPYIASLSLSISLSPYIYIYISIYCYIDVYAHRYSTQIWKQIFRYTDE